MSKIRATQYSDGSPSGVLLDAGVDLSKVHQWVYNVSEGRLILAIEGIISPVTMDGPIALEVWSRLKTFYGR